MADAISIQELIDARTDAKTLEEAVNGDAVTTVLSRLGETYPTLANALSQIDGKLDSADAQIKQAITDLFQNGGLPATPFATKALMTASALIDGKYAQVTDDTVNNGLYVKKAGAWVKSAYDPTALANTYTDNKVKGVTNNFKTKELMTASALPNDSYAMVTDDTEANNGWYSKVAGAWVKSSYDPVAQAKTYTDSLPVTTPSNNKTALAGKNIYQKSTDILGFYTGTTGKISAQIGAAIQVIPVRKNETYTIYSPSSLSSAYISYGETNTITAGKQLVLATVINEPNGVKRVVIPEGVNFLFINTKLAAGYDVTDTLIINKNLPMLVGYGNSEVVDLTARDELTTAIRNKDLTLTAFAEKNILADGLYHKPYYINYTTRKIISTTGDAEIVSFAVVAGETYSVYSPDYKLGTFNLTVSDQPFAANLITSPLELTDTAEPTVKNFVVPVGMTWAYMTVSFPPNNFDVRGDIWVNKGDTSSKFIRSAVTRINGYEVNDALAQQRIDDLQVVAGGVSPLKGRKWALIGDSITHKNSHALLSYYDHISNDVGGITIYNYGRSGNGYYNLFNKPNEITELDVDLLTIFMGINDYGSGSASTLPLGEFLDDVTTTTAGCINTLFKNAIAKFPTKRIAVFTPLPVSTVWGLNTPANDRGFTLNQLVDMIIKHAKHYGIPCFDMYSNNSLNLQNNTAKLTFAPDGTHPNDVGHRVLADKMKPFLESI